MRVLLDECLPRTLKRHLVGHEVTTVPEAGWAGTKNGELLTIAAEQFDAFISIDRGLLTQQSELPIRVILLSARTNRVADLLPLVPAILEALESGTADGIVRIGLGI